MVSLRNHLPLRIHPADVPVMAVLALAVLVAAIRLPIVGEPLSELLGIHAALLIAFMLGMVSFIRWESARWVQLARPALIVGIIFTLYSTLGRLGMVAFAYRADAVLSDMDNMLFGLDPSLAIQPYLSPGRIEFFSFVYGAFIPYINVTIALNCLSRPPVERDQFLTGWVFTYCISYLGYLFLPAQGPIILHAADYTVPLDGGFFYDVVVEGVAASGGLQGAFPSLHVGGSLYLCLFELRTNRLRGLIFLPLVLLIYLATVVLRYHYVIDLIVGTIIAGLCRPLGRAVFERWARRRQAAGLPALPGGEADALPAVPRAGAADAEAVLSAD